MSTRPLISSFIKWQYYPKYNTGIPSYRTVPYRIAHYYLLTRLTRRTALGLHKPGIVPAFPDGPPMRTPRIFVDTAFQMFHVVLCQPMQVVLRFVQTSQNIEPGFFVRRHLCLVARVQRNARRASLSALHQHELRIVFAFAVAAPLPAPLVFVDTTIPSPRRCPGSLHAAERIQVRGGRQAFQAGGFVTVHRHSLLSILLGSGGQQHAAEQHEL